MIRYLRGSRRNNTEQASRTSVQKCTGKRTSATRLKISSACLLSGFLSGCHCNTNVSMPLQHQHRHATATPTSAVDANKCASIQLRTRCILTNCFVGHQMVGARIRRTVGQTVVRCTHALHSHSLSHFATACLAYHCTSTAIHSVMTQCTLIHNALTRCNRAPRVLPAVDSLRATTRSLQLTTAGPLQLTTAACLVCRARRR